MQQSVRRRLAAGPDEGSSLVEVIVAMFIFALISVGVVHTMTSVLSVSRDSRSRQVALNLAAQAIDRSRESSDDLFALLSVDDNHHIIIEYFGDFHCNSLKRKT